MALTKVDDRGLKTPIDLQDNEKIRLGTGNDLQIDHSGTNSQIYHDGTGHLYIATQGSGEDLIIQAKNEFKVSTADSERMRIDSSGFVGIGMTPGAGTGYLLQLDSGAAQTFMTFGNSGSGNGATNGLVVGNDTSRAYFTQRENQPIFIATNNIDRVAIDEDGKVGIGRTDPAFLLDIKGAGYSTLRLNNSDETGAGSHDVRIVGGGSHYQNIYLEGSAFKFNTYDGSSVGERMRIDSSGRLLLGTTTEGTGAADDLTVATTGSTGITVRSGSSNDGSLFFSDGTSGADEYRGFIQYGHGSDNMLFGTNGSERMQIDDHGVLRVGNTHDQSTSGNTKRIALGAKGSIWGWASGQVNGALTLADNYYWDGTNNKAIESDYSAYLSLRSGSMRFGCTAASQTGGNNISGGIHEKVRFANDGHVEIADGNLVVASGHGIDFSATGHSSGNTSELFDDYEEGTWTPTGSWDDVVGTYTKIGRVVHAAFMVRVNTSGSANMGIGGLPFNCANNEASRNGVFWGWNEWDSTNSNYGQLTGNLTPNAADLGLYRMDGSGGAASYNQLGDNKILKGVICYQTA